ncbi:MAG TPA: alpha/beta hydrolase, partial [Sorangium sp.]|nr:alpha/beta hydrolase [Sorangium sp.]
IYREAVADLAPDLLRFLDEPRPTPRLRPGARAPRAAAVPVAPQASPRWQPWPDAPIRQWAHRSLSPLLRPTPQHARDDSASPADLGSRRPPVPC